MITKEQALALAEAKWWVGLEPMTIALFQMEERLLCMPFGLFHKSLEAALGRAVWTHELGLAWDEILAELKGERKAPSFADIVALIPPEKRILVVQP